MAELPLNEAPQKLKDLFNKGFASFERGNLDYAIDLLFSCVKTEPRFLHARKFLRAAEIQRFKKKKGLAKAMVSISSLPGYIAALSALNSGKTEKALQMAEKVMMVNPLDLKVVKLFSQAAEGYGLPEASIQTLLVAREHYPHDTDIMKMLGKMYMKAGMSKEGRELFEKLGELCPRDPEILKSIKDAMATESMVKDGWTEAGSFRDLIKDTDAALLLEKESKAVKADKDFETLIQDAMAKIEAEPDNINHYRALSRLYTDSKNFDEALETIGKALVMNPGDPELDNARSSIRVKKFDHEMEVLRAAGDEAGLEAKEREKVEFVFADLQERVARYPNDLRLHYEWGCKLFENDYVDEAIQEFQKSQRNPQLRQKSLLSLASCFRSKRQYDMALDQLTQAEGELVSMDATKKAVLYELGEILDLMGRGEKAFEYYKQIYQVDIGYKDIRDKVEKAYGQEG